LVNQRILQQIKDHDYNEAIASLYKTAYPNIRNYIMKNSGNIDCVKDIFHEAVIVLLETIRTNKFDESKEINGFLYTVARNKWINTVRKTQHATKYMDAQVHQNKDDFETSHEILLQKEMRLEMKSVIEKLSESCQKIIELVFYKNRSMDEIAEELGYNSRDTAKTAHYKCKQKLKDFIINSPTLKELYL
jgi:RNA polymerase sigma factor (sigma-70 family)